GGSKTSTMTKSKQRSAAESPGAAREWALKTKTWAAGPSFWKDFCRDGVIAIGWEDIDVDPSQASDEELREAIERAYPRDAADPARREGDPARAVRKIRRFVALREEDRETDREGDLVLICDGYAANSKTVRIYGFARVTGPFQNHLSAGWPRRFKHDANIQR